MNYSETAITPEIAIQQNEIPPFSDFIDTLKAKMKLVFHNRADINQLSLKRWFATFCVA
jgi:hypothetical protein